MALNVGAIVVILVLSSSGSRGALAQEPEPSSTSSSEPPVDVGGTDNDGEVTEGSNDSSDSERDATTTDTNGSEGSPSSLGVAAVSAFIGAAGVLAIDYALRRRAERLAFKASMKALRSELTSIVEESSARASEVPRAFAFYEPLPSMAWQAILMSTHHTRLARRDTTYDCLRQAYSAVAAANTLQGASWQAISLSQQAPDEETAEGFHEQALNLLHWPFAVVEERARLALDSLSESGR